jgi:CTP synthase
MQCSGYTVSAVKIDPYVNVDAGTMNPIEHGETFVLADGYETDQDMGNYERFLGVNLSRLSYMTTGSLYQRVIAKERSLGYKGKTVSVVPHVPLEVISQLQLAAKKEEIEIMIVEIGGTIGEYENILFLEAARMMKRQNPTDVVFVLVSYLPIPVALGEMKSKPTQQAIRIMQQSGIFPDIVIGRSQKTIDTPRKEKIAAASMLQAEDIISAPNMNSIYDIPYFFQKENLDKRLLKKLNLSVKDNKFSKLTKIAWDNFIQSTKKQKNELRIAVVGKYFSIGDFVLPDAYVSVIEALKYAGYRNNTKVILDWYSSLDFESGKKKTSVLKKYQGILIPGGFGNSGIDGKDMVIRFARENKIPFLGICLGMQRAVVEFAQHVCGINRAESDERASPKSIPIITTMEDQLVNINREKMGGSMRLGNYTALLKKGSLAEGIYKSQNITERHRHRYELNPEYIQILKDNGMYISGTSLEGELAEIVELDKKIHPFFIAVQYHPEFQSRPLQSHPLFDAFVAAGLEKK